MPIITGYIMPGGIVRMKCRLLAVLIMVHMYDNNSL